MFRPFPTRAYPALRCAVLWLLGVSLLVTTACGTPTPDPCPSYEEAVYLDKATEIVVGIDEQLVEVGRLFVLAGNDESLIYDEQWASLLAIALLILELYTEEIRDVVYVPTSVMHIHSDFEGMIDKIDRYVDAVTRVVSTWDVDAFVVATDALTQVQIAGISILGKSAEFVKACPANATQ